MPHHERATPSRDAGKEPVYATQGARGHQCRRAGANNGPKEVSGKQHTPNTSEKRPMGCCCRQLAVPEGATTSCLMCSSSSKVNPTTLQRCASQSNSFCQVEGIALPHQGVAKRRPRICAANHSARRKQPSLPTRRKIPPLPCKTPRRRHKRLPAQD